MTSILSCRYAFGKENIQLFSLQSKHSVFRLIIILFLLGLAPESFAQVNPRTTPKTNTKQTDRKKTDTLVYNLPSITVTSTRATERESPVTFSELTAKELREQHTNKDLPNLLADLPSTVVYSDNANGIGYTTLSIRGFDQRRISVMVNGIPQNDPDDHNAYWINMPDLTQNAENIQVQRGAGLMNYGSAAIGGSINITTSNFANKKFARLTAGIGLQEFQAGGRNSAPDDAPNLASSRLSAEVSSGLMENNLSVYARLSRITSRGYRDNSWADLQSYFMSIAHFSSSMTIQLNVFGGPISDGLAYTGLPKSFVTDPTLRRSNFSDWGYRSDGSTISYTVPVRNREIENFSQPHAEILTDIKLAENVTLKSSLFYYTGEGFFDFDGSWADSSLLRLSNRYSGLSTITNPTNTIIRSWVGNKHGGFIPRLVWEQGNGNQLTVGAEIRLHRGEHWGKISYAENLPEGYNPDYKIYSYNSVRNIFSGFARQMYSPMENLTLNVEAQLVATSYGIENERAGNIFTRYSTVQGQTIEGGRIFTVNYMFLNPRIGANYNINAEQNVYLSLALTSREPRRNNLYRASESYTGAQPNFAYQYSSDSSLLFDFTKPNVRPERLYNTELGWNYSTESLTLGVTGYWMEFSDELVRNGQRDIFGVAIEQNAPRTRHIGLELQGKYAFYSFEGTTFFVSGNTTISRNRIIEYSYTSSNGSRIDWAGNQIAGFPELMATINLGLRHSNYSLIATMKYVGDMRSDNFGNRINEYRALDERSVRYVDNLIPAYTVFNAIAMADVGSMLGYSPIRLRLQVNNLLNRLYAAGAVGREFFPAAERNWFVGFEAEL